MASLVKAADGLLHTIASSVPCDASWSVMLRRDVAEVSRALVRIQGPAPSRPVSAATPAPDAALLERVAREAAIEAYDLGKDDGQEPAKGLGATLDAAVIRTMHIDRAVARAIAAAKGGAA